MRRLLGVFLAAVLSAATTSIHAQPVLRDGWPHDYGIPNTSSFVEPNPLSIAVTQDGVRLVVTATATTIRVYDIDGNELNSWAVSGTVPNPAGANYLCAGPNIGDLDGDGDLELVAALRSPTATTRAIAAFSLSGDILTGVTRGYAMGAGHIDISTVTLADIDDDGADEVIYTAYDTLYALNGDGSAAAGFPWPLNGQTHWVAGPVVVPGDDTHDPVIVWATQNNQLHARSVGGMDELPGWPVGFTASADGYIAGPVIIPTETGWIVSLCSTVGVNAWTDDGLVVAGFPMSLTNVDGVQITSMSVADVDADGSPDLLVKASNDFLHAVGLDGAYLAGFPYSLQTNNGMRETISAMRENSASEALLFVASMTLTVGETQLFGLRNHSPLPGFPVDITTNENIPRIYTALFPPEDGILPIVVHSILGYTAVYDLPVTATQPILEWAMPAGTREGNRVYSPTEAGVIEGPRFAFRPRTLDFGEVEVGDSSAVDLEIINWGTEEGEIEALEFDVAHAEDFSIDLSPPLTLAPGDTETAHIVWTPSAAGLLTGTLTITHSDTSVDGETALTLAGNAIALPSLAFEPLVLNFGEVTVGETGFAELEITNEGSAPGLIVSWTVDPAVEDQVQVVGDFPLPVQPGATISITLAWQPGQIGDFSGSVTFTHNDYQAGGEQVIGLTGSAYYGVAESGVPSTYFLAQNRPNPFNSTTAVRFGMKEAGTVRLTVYNVSGREVARLVDGRRPAGVHEAVFVADRLASGVYFVELRANGFRDLKKMILLR